MKYNKKFASAILAAMTMVTAFAPVNTFALGSNFSSTAIVDGTEEEKTNFSATFDIEDIDKLALKDGTVTVQLVGDDAKFVKGSYKVEDTDGDNSFKDITQASDTYMIFEVNAKTKDLEFLQVSGQVEFDDAQEGEYKVIYDLTDIGLGKYERVFAKVRESEKEFAKRSGEKVKKVSRGTHKMSSIEIKGRVGDKIELTVDRDLEWDMTDTKVSGSAVTKKNDRTVEFTMAHSKVIFTPSLRVTRDTPKGDIDIDVFRDRTNDRTTVTVGEYVDYGVDLELKKRKVKEVFANGDTFKVDVTLKTTDKDTLPKYLDVEVEGAEVNVTANVPVSGPATGKDRDGNLRFDNDFEIATEDKNEVRLTFNIKPDWDFTGDVTAKVKGRGFDEKTLTLLKVNKVATVETKVKEVLGGASKVMVNDIVIKESEKGAFKSGNMYGVSLASAKFDYVKFENKGTIEADGIKIKDYTLDKADRTLYFTVNGTSKSPATITIKNAEIVSSRALPLGVQKLALVNVEEFKNGKTKRGRDYAFTSNKEGRLNKIDDVNFIDVVAKQSKLKKTTVFTLGSTDYTVDGSGMTLDTAVFTQDDYTMLPVRAIADALGIQVLWNQDNMTATFIDGDIVVTVTQDSKVLYKNGIAYPMTTKATTKANRMFIPISSIGDAFGLNRGTDYTYDSSNHQVTIYPER